MKNQKYYRVILTKKQKDVVINALSRLKYVLPEDADYRGEVGVLLINLSQQPFTINDGERIAQMIIARHEQAELVEVETLDETERGAGGYGHTGVN